MGVGLRPGAKAPEEPPTPLPTTRPPSTLPTNTGLKWAWKAEVQSRDEVALARWFRSRIASTANTMPRGGNRTEAPACRRVRW